MPATSSADVGTLHAERAELARDWAAWQAERRRLDGEEACNAAWRAQLLARERRLTAAVPGGRE